MNLKRKTWIPAFAGMTIAGTLWAGGLVAIPSTFDFGWCPANAKVSCEFVIKNTSESAIFLESFKPSCGCTAPQFAQETLAAENETKIGLTFNTRGYEGSTFRKPATLKAGGTDTGIEVTVMGHVLDPNAKVVPIGSGVIHFEPGRSNNQQIALQNKSSNEVTLKLVQKPADWAQIDLGPGKIEAGGTLNLKVKVKGSLESERISSVTFEAIEPNVSHRLTLAIRTGPQPDTYRPPQYTAPSPSSPPKNKPPAENQKE